MIRFWDKYEILYQNKKMDIILPFDQLRFNIILRALITIYGASSIWNFMAFIPECPNEEEEVIWYKKSNYSFRLISSLLFFLLWISQFKYTYLTYLTVWEMLITIVAYIHLSIAKRHYLKENKKKLKEINTNRMNNFNEKVN